MSLSSSFELKYELKKKEKCKIIIVPIVNMLVLQRRWVDQWYVRIYIN